MARNNAIIDHNLPLWAAFFAKHSDLFQAHKPDGSCMGFAKYTGQDGIEDFARKLVEQAGVLLLPSSIYASNLGHTPADHFRYGFGRTGLEEGLHVMDDFLSE